MLSLHALPIKPALPPNDEMPAIVFAAAPPGINWASGRSSLISLKVPRITSYNVCYTKLLRLDGTEDVKIVLEGANKAYSSKNTENKSYRDYWKDLISLNQGEIYISNFDLNIDRITSYNVCYTKLLRRFSKYNNSCS